MEEIEGREALRSRADTALDQLWAMAQSGETPQAERVKLLQWFVTMGVGTPRQMVALDAAPEGGGVVILPEVMTPPAPPDGAEFTV